MSSSSIKSHSTSTNSKSSSSNLHKIDYILCLFLRAKDNALSSFELLDSYEEILNEDNSLSPMYIKYNSNVYLLSSRNVTRYDFEEAVCDFNQNNITFGIED